MTKSCLCNKLKIRSVATSVDVLDIVQF